VLTNACNFACAYCRQPHGDKSLDSSEVEQAIEFFWPFFAEECHINFYGGEPLLEFDKIRKAVQFIEKKNRDSPNQFHYSLSTNGFLLNDERLEFLNRKKFSVLLSFDGYAQEKARQRGSFSKCVSIIEKFVQYQDIHLKTNSVFLPETVKYFSESISFIVELGVPNIRFSFDCTSDWLKSDCMQLRLEFEKLRRFSIEYSKIKETLPINFWSKDYSDGMFYCAAGKDRIALAPDGILWGCHAFPAYFDQSRDPETFEKFSFGHLSFFTSQHDEIYSKKVANYSPLVMDNFYSCEGPCILCDNIFECRVCPVYAAYTSKKIGKIPTAVCVINKIMQKEKERFWKELL